MDVTYELTRNGRVFVYHLSGALDMKEVKKWMMQWERDYLDPAPLPVYYIADFSGITTLPHNLLSSAQELGKKPSPNLKIVYVVSQNLFVLKMGAILGRLLRYVRLKVVSSKEEAWQEIEHELAMEAPQAKGDGLP